MSREPSAAATAAAKASKVMRAISEPSSRSTTREATTTSESAETSTATPSAPASASAPAAATPLTQYPERNPQQTAATDDQQQDQDLDDPSKRDRHLFAIVLRGRHRVFRTGQRDAELGGERLGDEVDAKRQALAVVFGAQRGEHGIADPAGARVGEETLGAAPHGDEDIARARLVILPGNEEHDHAGVLARVPD